MTIRPSAPRPPAHPLTQASWACGEEASHVCSGTVPLLAALGGPLPCECWCHFMRPRTERDPIVSGMGYVSNSTPWWASTPDQIIQDLSDSIADAPRPRRDLP